MFSNRGLVPDLDVPPDRFERGSLEVTPIGWILIFLGAVFFLVRPNLLYWCAIFFLPFSATAVVNVSSGDSFSGLQAWMFFGALWLAYDAAKVLRTRNRWYRSQMRSSSRNLIVFFLVAVVSLVMPVWIAGRLSIQSATFLSNEAQPLFFRMQHVTQILYLAFGVVFTIFVAVKNTDLQEFRETVRILVLSSIFVCSWGLLQWVCFETGASYPAFIFNTSKNEAAMGYLAESSLGDLGVARISSVSTEPSMLAQYLLIVLVFALFAVIGRQVITSVFWDRFTVGLVSVMLLLTTSSTAYLGLGLLIPACLYAFSRMGKIRGRSLIISAVILFATVAFVYTRFTTVQDLLEMAIFSKAGSYSGLERLNSIAMAWGYFTQYPLLGVGWGSVTSHDLIFKLLANAGVCGLIAFGLFLISMWAGLWASMSGIRNLSNIPAQKYWACCVLVASLILIFTNIFSEFAVVYGHLWFVFGMALAVAVDQSRKAKSGPTQPQEARV